MPALAADQVTLEEVLEVRGGPLTEQQLWCLLCLSSEALQDVFSDGQVLGKGVGLFSITPQTLLLCFGGGVKFCLNSVNYDRSFTAPETYARRNSPNGSAVEKVCVYSLGMTLYYASEYKVPVGKPIRISDSLEAVLLSMCEEAAQVRCSLVQVIKECRKQHERGRYKDIVTSLVKSVLGNEVSVVDRTVPPRFSLADSNHFINGGSNSPINVSLDLASPRSLPSPPPLQTSSRGLPTAAEFVGSNQRQEQSPRDLERSLPTAKSVPHLLDKYKNHIEKSRVERNQQLPENMGSILGKVKADSLDVLSRKRPLWHQSKSIPNNYGGMHAGKDPVYYDSDDKGYNEGPAPGLQQNGRHRPDLISSTGFHGLRRYGSEGSFTDTSSYMSGPHSGFFSDGRSSSAVSLTQGSYAPEYYVNDGYESDLYMKSTGSSIFHGSQADGRGSRLSRHFSSKSDQSSRSVTKQVSVNSVPFSDEVDAGHIDQLRYSSVPNLHEEPNARRPSATGSNTKLKTFFGPEFVQVSEDPDKSIITIANRKGGQLPPGRKMVTVVLLNGQRLQIMVETSGKTQALFDQVIKYLDITEKIFFGLTQLQEEEHVFLDLDVKLAKYAPAKWKEENKGTDANFTLFFRVKFYVEHMSLLTQPRTRHQYYLQLRKDILEARMHCHEEAAFILAGLALQAEISDYDETLGQNYFMAEHYLPQRVLAKLPGNLAYEHLPEIHQNFAGFSDDDAELEFLKEAQKLPEYGIHFYKVATSKKPSGEDKWLGICVRGVTVYEACGHVKTPVHRNSWQMTKKLSFQKKKFFIESRIIESGGGAASKMTFYTKHYKKAKYLLQMCTAFHRFQMKMKSRLAAVEQEVAREASIEIVENGAQQSPYKRVPGERRHSAPESKSVYHNRPEINSEQPQAGKNDGRDIHSNGRDIVQRPVNGNLALRRMSIVSSDEESEVQQKSESEDYEMPTNRHRRTGLLPRQNMVDHSFERSFDAPYVIDASVTSQAFAANEPDHKMFGNEVIAKKDITRSPDREIKVIKLDREPGKGIGITVVGGENSKRLDFGIYIKTITEGGAAWKDGRLKAGDRILAVNGQSLEQITHEAAVGLLKNAPPRVELVVSQSPHNASSIVDLSSVPSPKSYGEEPESLEVKSLVSERITTQNSTVVESQGKHYLRDQLPSPQADHEDQLDRAPRAQVDHSVEEEDGGQTTEQQASSLAFPSEDEPVTMVSKSISSLAAQYEKLSSPQEKEVVMETEIRPSHQEQDFANPGLSVDMKDDYVQPVHGNSSVPEEYSKSQETQLLPSFPLTNIPSLSDAVDASTTTGFKPVAEKEKLSVSTRSTGDVKIGYNPYLAEMREKVIPEGSSSSLGDDNITDKSFVVNLEKKDGSLGLSVTGGINTSVKLGGIYVKSLYPNGPADLDGRIRVGDRILNVNGISLVGVTHKQAVETIKKAPPVTRLTVDRSVPVNISSRSNKLTRSLATDQPFTVELAKSVGGLGLSLVGGTDSEPEHGGLLRIKKMFPGQPSALSGKLQVGDIVQEVNGNSLQGVTHQEAINLIRVSGPVVQLVVKREPASIPSSLLSRSSSNASDIDPAQILAEIQNKLRQNDDEGSIKSSRRAFGLTPKSSMGSYSSVTSVASSSQAITEESTQPLQSSSDNRDQVDSGKMQSKDHGGSSYNKVFLQQFSEPSLPIQSRDYGLLATSPSMPPRPLSQSVSAVQNIEPAQEYPEESVEGENGLIDNEKEVELESREESSELESDSEESSDDKPTPHDIRPSIEQNVDPLPESSPDEDEPSLEPANNQLTAVSEAETNKSLTETEEIIEIELIKGSGGLGFTLSGGADTTGGCFVRDVIGDPAKADGRLRKGDQITKVDGVDITGLKHMEAVNILRSTDRRVKLVVLRRPQMVVSYGQSGVIETVNLTRTSRGRIGLIIKESDDGGIYVDDVVPGEPASVEGNLKNGDVILEINGHQVHGTGFLAARQCLDAARPVVRLMVQRKIRIVESKYATSGTEVSGPVSSGEGVENLGFSRDSDSEDEQQNLETAKDVFDVELKKGERGFGFSLVAATTSLPGAQGIFIKTVSPGSVAEKDGRMKVGDQLLKVDDEDVRGMSHARVINMLRKITGTVRLELSRPTEYSRELRLSSPPTHVGTNPRSNPIIGRQTSNSQLSNRAGDTKEQLTRENSGSLDLDITLEDKSKSLTGSDCAKDEDDVIELLNAISEENRRLQHKPPPVHRRDTDTVLSSLLTSAEPPPSALDSLPPLDFSDSDSEAEDPPDSHSEGSRGKEYKNPSDWASAEDSLPEDTVNRRQRSSEESENTRRSLVSASSSTDSIDTPDDSDLDVFDMLRDNSQIVIDAIKESNQPITAKSVMNSSQNNRPPINLVGDENAAVPPPIPTTPIPSDDELIAPEKTPLREFIANNIVENGGLFQDAPDLPPKRGSYRQIHDDVIGSHPHVPLIRVVSSGHYSGNQLKTLINSLQGKLESNLPNEEFKGLRDVRPVDGCDTAKRAHNKDKNRYRNVLPFDKTRVKLRGNEEADYINANHVKVKVGGDMYSYIACQGPLPSTTADFWQMVWEQKAQVIAMLTLEMESGKVKCHRYWPETRDQPLVLGESFQVTLQSKKITDTYIERAFTLRNLLDGTFMDIVHLNFTRWPDHGVPKYSADLVQFIQYMRSLPSSGPIIVHCSAGIGRSGALITVDVALGMMEKDLPFEINKTIRHLREQRPGMIQTKEQYTFCYKACLDVLRSLDS